MHPRHHNLNLQAPGDRRIARAVVGPFLALLLAGSGMAQYYEIRTNTRPNVYYQWTHAVTGDFDNSGQIDLVASLSGPIFVVFLDPATNGILTPTSNVVLPTYYGIGARIRTGDFNGDGNLDIFAINNGNLADVLLGQGNGTFTIVPWPVELPSIIAIHELHVGDLNNDGIDDLVLRMADSTTVYLKAYLNSNLQWTETWSASFNYSPVGDDLLNDFNGDGNIDLKWFVPGTLYPNGTPTFAMINQVHVAVGLGNGGFGPDMTFALGLTPGTFYTQLHGDFDMDGLSDVLLITSVAAPDGRILYGNPFTTLESFVTFVWPTNLGGYYSSGGANWHLFAFDADVDGDVDLIRVAAFGVTQFPWWPFTLGGMTFQVLNSTGYRTYATSVRQDVMVPAPAGSFYWPADYDKDGDVDLLGLPSSWFDSVYLENTAEFGSGCAGSTGVPQVSQTNLALGNWGYSLSVSGAQPLAPAALRISLAKAPTQGCGVQLDLSPNSLVLPALGLGITTTDLNGAASIGITLPPSPSLAGVTTYAQWFIGDPAGALVVAPGLTYSATPARTLILW